MDLCPSSIGVASLFILIIADMIAQCDWYSVVVLAGCGGLVCKEAEAGTLSMGRARAGEAGDRPGEEEEEEEAFWRERFGGNRIFSSLSFFSRWLKVARPKTHHIKQDPTQANQVSTIK